MLTAHNGPNFVEWNSFKNHLRDGSRCNTMDGYGRRATDPRPNVVIRTLRRQHRRGCPLLQHLFQHQPCHSPQPSSPEYMGLKLFFGIPMNSNTPPPLYNPPWLSSVFLHSSTYSLLKRRIYFFSFCPQIMVLPFLEPQQAALVSQHL